MFKGLVRRYDIIRNIITNISKNSNTYKLYLYSYGIKKIRFQIRFQLVRHDINAVCEKFSLRLKLVYKKIHSIVHEIDADIDQRR